MLSRTLLRMLTVETLLGIKVLDGHVDDSLIVSLDEGKDSDWPSVMAIVYTETMDRAWSGSGQPKVELAIEILAGIESVFETDEGEVVVIPQRMDARAELMCDLVEDEIDATFRDVGNDWADLWREFGQIAGPIKSFCGVDAKGKKRALRKVIIPVEVVKSPPRGMALPGIWERAISKIEADGQNAYKAVAGLIRGVMERGEVAAWAKDIESAGLSRESALIIGLDSREDYDRSKNLKPIKMVEIAGVQTYALTDSDDPESPKTNEPFVERFGDDGSGVILE